MKNKTGVLFGRSMRHITRSPDTIITVALVPIMMMLLFVFVYGGAIKMSMDPSVNYVSYMLPGVLLMAIASGIAYTSLRLFTDIQGGLFARFSSMPIKRSSILWGACADLSCFKCDFRPCDYPDCADYRIPFQRGHPFMACRNGDTYAVYAGVDMGFDPTGPNG